MTPVQCAGDRLAGSPPSAPAPQWVPDSLSSSPQAPEARGLRESLGRGSGPIGRDLGREVQAGGSPCSQARKGEAGGEDFSSQAPASFLLTAHQPQSPFPGPLASFPFGGLRPTYGKVTGRSLPLWALPLSLDLGWGSGGKLRNGAVTLGPECASAPRAPRKAGRSRGCRRQARLGPRHQRGARGEAGWGVLALGVSQLRVTDAESWGTDPEAGAWPSGRPLGPRACERCVGASTGPRGCGWAHGVAWGKSYTPCGPWFLL